MPALSVAGESPLYGLSTMLAKRAIRALILGASKRKTK